MPTVFEHIGNGELLEVKKLVNRANVNRKTPRGVTVLMYAATRGEIMILNYFLQIGADPNIVLESSGDTALIMAAEAGHLDCVQALCTLTGSRKIAVLIDFQNPQNGLGKMQFL